MARHHQPTFVNGYQSPDPARSLTTTPPALPPPAGAHPSTSLHANCCWHGGVATAQRDRPWSPPFHPGIRTGYIEHRRFLPSNLRHAATLWNKPGLACLRPQAFGMLPAAYSNGASKRWSASGQRPLSQRRVAATGEASPLTMYRGDGAANCWALALTLRTSPTAAATRASGRRQMRHRDGGQYPSSSRSPGR